MNSIRRILPVCLTLAVVLLFALPAYACPTCKDSLGGEHSAMIEAYFWSIIFMMSMPFLILSALGLYFYILVCRARARGDYAKPLPQSAAARPPVKAVGAEMKNAALESEVAHSSTADDEELIGV